MSTRRYVVARAADLADGEKMAVEVGGRSVAIFNVRGTFYGLLNRCPHRGADLCAGRFLPRVTAAVPGEYHYDTDQTFLACPWHGWEFDVTTGQSYFDPVGMRGRPYSVEIENGAVVASELEAGTLAVSRMTPQQYAAAVGGAGTGMQPGPLHAETVTVEVEDDYLVVDLRPQRPQRRTP
ncbi:Rieske (2Fe-2S) protein [Nocardioides panacihumi]|uniref:Rieske (2Fe-2S) protein n=1 Tax=Nocardioides panacihumi TaxID=400774 RepID=A0ABP5BLF3_9ACTN